MGKVWRLRAGGLRKDDIFYCRPAKKKDSIIYSDSIAKEAVSARSHVGYVVVHFKFPSLKNGRLQQLDCSTK